MINKSKYYQSSGAYSLTGIIITFFACLVATLILSAVYGYIIFYSPFIYINFIGTALFGFSIGVCINYIGHKFKTRNKAIATLMGAILGVVGLYCAWVFWIHALSKQEYLAIDPSDIFSFLQVLAEKGVWTIKKITPTGFFLYAIWGIEGLIILGIAIGLPFLSDDIPFCEPCNTWVDGLDTISRLEPIQNAPSLIAKLEQGNFEDLKNLNKLENSLSNHPSTQIDLNYCKSCKKCNYLTIKNITYVIDDKKVETKVEKDIVSNLIISAAQHEILKTNWKKKKEEAVEPKTNSDESQDLNKTSSQ